MNETTTLPLDLSALREGAEEMARDVHGALPHRRPWGDYSEDWRDGFVCAHARLLADLTRDDTRDRWVRWGETNAPDYPTHTTLCGRTKTDWLGLRDDPKALRTAILALSEKP